MTPPTLTHPKHPAALEAILGGIRSGKTDGLGELSALYEEYPESTEVLGHLIYAHCQRAEHEKALVLCGRLLALDPGNKQAKLFMGDRLVRLRRLDEAEAVYERVTREHPEDDAAKPGIRYVQHLRQRRREAGQAGALLIHEHREATQEQRDNQTLSVEEFESRKLRLRSKPHGIFLASTTKCNFLCLHCEKGYDPYHGNDLADDVIERTKREILPWARTVGLTGFGEPMLAQNFDKILAASVEHGASSYFTTNASLMNFDRLEQIIHGSASVEISVDGSTKEMFEAIRVGGNFERTMDRLNTVRRLRQIHTDKPHSSWTLNFVALTLNIHELPDVIRIAKRYEIECVKVLDYHYNFREYDKHSLRNDVALGRRWFAEAQGVADELGIVLTLPPLHEEETIPTADISLWAKIKRAGRLFPVRNRFPQRCADPWMKTYVNDNGSVTACCLATKSLGSLRTSSFDKIWNGWRYRFLRWRIDTPLPPLMCRNCHMNLGVNSGNAGNVMAKEGLIIKGLYQFEIRLAQAIGKVQQAWKRFSRRPRPNPNYWRGKPISEKNRPGVVEHSAP